MTLRKKLLEERIEKRKSKCCDELTQQSLNVLGV